MNLKNIFLPDRYNYIAFFLTLHCNLNCLYCLNLFGQTKKNKYSLISGKRIVKAINRLHCNNDLPITLQGGEPSLHPDFFWIINNIRSDLSIDILTNLNFDINKFIKHINPTRLHRDAPYANIRASYHPGQIEMDVFINKILKLKKADFSIGAYGIMHPIFKDHILCVQKKCERLGIDFRIKEFLGYHEGNLCGTYHYPSALDKNKKKSCKCRTSELIIGPKCNVYRCHHDLYMGFPPIGNLLDPEFAINDSFKFCNQYGNCNPCDVKLKTNRLQEFGHCSVEIKEIVET